MHEPTASVLSDALKPALMRAGRKRIGKRAPAGVVAPLRPGANATLTTCNDAMSVSCWRRNRPTRIAIPTCV